MKPTTCLLLLLASFWREGAAGQVTVEGMVPLAKPPARPVPLPHYPNQTVRPGPSPPALPVVYLEGHFPAIPEPPRPVQMGQRELQFHPSVLPVRVGTPVEFPNYDDLYHNVFSYSKPRRFDLGRYRKDEKPTAQVFEKPGLARLNCEIHEHMRAVILVLDTPYFGSADTNGHFRLENLPEGKFLLKAWLNESTTLERPVELKSGGAMRVDFIAP